MPGQAIVSIRDKQWGVSIANTPWECAQGLGGLTSLPANTGMLFDVGSEQLIPVTTEGMLFPLDVAFLSDSLVVVDLVQDFVPGHRLTSVRPARFFVEVNAHEMDGIDLGDRASIELLTPPAVPLQAPDWVQTMLSFMGFAIVAAFLVGMVRNITKGMLGSQEHHSKLPGHPSSEEETTFPPEARKDLTFCKHMWELEKTMGRSLTREEVAEKWESWKKLRYRPKTEEERKLSHSLKYGTDELPERGKELEHHSEIMSEEWREAEGMWEVTKEDAQKGEPSGVYLWALLNKYYPGNKDKQIRLMGFMAEVSRKYRGHIPKEEAWNLARKWDVEKMLAAELVEFFPAQGSSSPPKAKITRRYMRPYLTNWQYGGYSYVEEDPTKPEELWTHGMVDYADPDEVIAVAQREGISEISLAGGFWEEIGYKGYGERISIGGAKTALAKARKYALGSSNSSEHHSPGIIVLPKLPEEARGDILFYEYIRDYVKLSGKPPTEEEVKWMWEAWEKPSSSTGIPHHSPPFTSQDLEAMERYLELAGKLTRSVREMTA